MIKKAGFWIGICVMLSPLAQAGAQSVSPDQATIHALDSLKKSDDLANWLYLRIDYSYAKPKESLGFLMHTERDLWRKPKLTSEKEAWLMLLSNQAYNQLYAGYILESIDRYEKAYNYYIDHKLNVDGIAEYVLKPWANNYTRLGDYEKALFIQSKTLDYAKREDNTALMAAMYNNMAISYRSMGDLEKAEHYVNLGLSRSSPTSAEIILLINTLADVYKEKGLFNQAGQLITDNISRQKKTSLTFESAYWLLSSYITAGDIQLAKNQYAEAEKYYQLGLTINEQYYKGNRLREKANVITQLGKVKLKQNRPAEANRYFDQTLSMLGLFKEDRSIEPAKVFGDNRLIEVFYQKAMAHGMLGQDEQALQNIQYALFAADKIRFELADVKTRQRFQAETKTMAGKAISIAFALLEKTKRHRYAEIILHITEQTKSRTLLDDIRNNQQQFGLQVKDTLFVRKQSLERAIAYQERQLLQEENFPNAASIRNTQQALLFKLDYVETQLRHKYPTLKRANLPNAKQLLGQLPADLHVIEFFAGSADWYVIEIFNRRIKQIKRIKNPGLLDRKIADFVSTYYHNGPAAMANQPRVFFETAHSIYQILLGGLSLGKTPKTVLIPDEVLGYLSFDGLPTDKQYHPSISKWPFLIRKTTLSYAFSIQTWLNQSGRKENTYGFSGLFITHQKGNQQFIPAVAREAEAIEDIISGKFIRDDQATVKRFFKAFDQSSVLHVSTHAYLSGQQKEPTIALQDDQIFLFELSARQHTPSLVVLSACRTADGMMAKGEGIISLSRGFAAIGTPGTIAGLWNVNDDAAAAITTETYRNLASSKDISTSLHLAKLNWLTTQGKGQQEYLPYYWDALIFMGYDQPLNLKPAGRLISGNFMTIAFATLAGAAILFALIGWRLKAPGSAR